MKRLNLRKTILHTLIITASLAFMNCSGGDDDETIVTPNPNSDVVGG